MFVCLCMLRPTIEYSYSLAFAIDLKEYSIFVVPEFLKCGNCGCLKNRGEICHHLEECFTGFKDDDLESPTFRIEEKPIVDRVSYILAFFEFAVAIYSIIILCFFFFLF